MNRYFNISPHLWLAFATGMSLLSPQVCMADGYRNQGIMLSADSLPSAYICDDMQSMPLPDCDAWWQTFDDPSLVALVQTAVANNYDLRAALRRIDASRQMLRSVYAGYYPTLSAFAGYDRSEISGRATQPYDAAGETSSAFSIGATVSWEIDIFGRVAEKAKGSKATLSATRLEYEGLMISVAAEVAQDYADLRMYQRQLEIARGHLESQAEVLRTVQAQYDAGLVSKLDVAQAKNTMNTTRLLIPSLESGMTTARNALLTLCGVGSDDKLNALLSDSTVFRIVPPPGIGSPADLVRRRPDVAETEKQVEVLASQLGVAKKDWLPVLSLDATIETSSHSVGHLFGSNSLAYSVSPRLSWTIFDGFQREAGIAEARAEMEAEMNTYNSTLLTAVQEVNNALASYHSAVAELQLYDDAIADSREVLRLSLERYRLGLTDFSDVATAQISLLTTETSFETIRANCFNALVNLYKALGGGWCE